MHSSGHSCCELVKEAFLLHLCIFSFSQLQNGASIGITTRTLSALWPLSSSAAFSCLEGELPTELSHHEAHLPSLSPSDHSSKLSLPMALLHKFSSSSSSLDFESNMVILWRPQTQSQQFLPSSVTFISIFGQQVACLLLTFSHIALHRSWSWSQSHESSTLFAESS